MTHRVGGAPDRHNSSILQSFIPPLHNGRGRAVCEFAEPLPEARLGFGDDLRGAPASSSHHRWFLIFGATVCGLLMLSSPTYAEQVFARRLDEYMTGSSDTNITGQDSAIFAEKPEETNPEVERSTTVLFGDSTYKELAHCRPDQEETPNGNIEARCQISNSMANIADGVQAPLIRQDNLDFVYSTGIKPGEVLPPTHAHCSDGTNGQPVGDECLGTKNCPENNQCYFDALWFSSVFYAGRDLYAFFGYFVRPYRAQGSGVAKYDTATRQFVPLTPTNSVPDTLPYAFAVLPPRRPPVNAFVLGDLLYFFSPFTPVGDFFPTKILLGRLDLENTTSDPGAGAIREGHLVDQNDYEYLQEDGQWLGGDAGFASAKSMFPLHNQDARVTPRMASPSVQWNDFLCKWVAVSTPLSVRPVGPIVPGNDERGWVYSSLQIHTATSLDGGIAGWGHPTSLFIPPDEQFDGSLCDMYGCPAGGVGEGFVGYSYNVAILPAAFNLDDSEVMDPRRFYVAASSSKFAPFSEYNVSLYEIRFGDAESTLSIAGAEDIGLWRNTTSFRSGLRALYLPAQRPSKPEPNYEVGLRFSGKDEWFSAEVTDSTKLELVLPLKRAPSRAGTISLAVKLGNVNEGLPFDLDSNPPDSGLPTITVNVDVATTDTELRVPIPPSAFPALASIRSQQDWVRQGSNTIDLYIYRTDYEKVKLRLPTKLDTESSPKLVFGYGSRIEDAPACPGPPD